ncbi:hypothetical protein M1N51_00970 [Peptococcaceae bacterium]|nr:hypothetical protein [Peptococcaceae bacterium]
MTSGTVFKNNYYCMELVLRKRWKYGTYKLTPEGISPYIKPYIKREVIHERM